MDHIADVHAKRCQKHAVVNGLRTDLPGIRLHSVLWKQGAMLGIVSPPPQITMQLRCSIGALPMSADRDPILAGCCVGLAKMPHQGGGG